MSNLKRVSGLFSRLKGILWLGSFEANLIIGEFEGSVVGRLTFFDYAHKLFTVTMRDEYLDKCMDNKDFNGILEFFTHEFLHVIIGAPAKTREDEPAVLAAMGETAHTLVFNRSMEREEQSISNATNFLVAMLKVVYKKKLQEFRLELFPVPIKHKKKKRK